MFWIISRENTPKAIDFASTGRSVLLRSRSRISVTAEEMKEFSEKYSDLNIESGEEVIKATSKPKEEVKEEAEEKVEEVKPTSSTPKTEDRKSGKRVKSKSKRR